MPARAVAREELEGRPFVILGVNSDPKERVKQAIKKENLTWRSGGMEQHVRPIATQWNIEGWPTLYLIDHPA